MKSKDTNPAYSARVPARTLTISFDGFGKAHLGPTLGLRTLTGDKEYAFRAFKIQGRQKRLLTIGASADNDIVIEDEAASRYHCLIFRQRRQVFVRDCDSKNGVWLDGVRVQLGELRPHATLTLGRTTLVAYGPQDDQGANIKATSPDQFLRRAVALYGGIRAASRGFGIAYSTFRDKIEKLTRKSRKTAQRSPSTRGTAGVAQGKPKQRATQGKGKAEAAPAKRAGTRGARSRRARAKRRR